jgi:hypothetical protein
LAGEIDRHCGPLRYQGEEAEDSYAAAFQAYDNKFRPFMSQVPKGAGDPSVFDKIQWSPFTIAVLYWVIWLASCLRLDYAYAKQDGLRQM